MAEPDPSAVSPWYLRNITQALALDETTGNVYLRSSIVGGNVTIAGNVVVSNITVDAIGNIDVSGNTMPVSGNINIDAGNVTAFQGTDPWNIQGNVGITGTPTVSFGVDATDAFGRLRVSEPFTLYDTQTRYYDHNQFSSNIAGNASVVFNANSSSFELNVGGGTGDSVQRETVRVFPYQPGKSLLIYSTFCGATPVAGLLQRVGYFDANNGIFFEVNGTTLNMVIRSKSTGVIVEDRIPQSQWNGDRLNGAGGVHNPSGMTLNPALDQIFFCDVEWLGVGSVRVGFIINGAYVNCHTFNHANTPSTSTTDNTTTYMTTATLPLRYEITCTGPSVPSKMRQVCSTVISEGGYTLTGVPRSASQPLGTPIRLPNDNSFKPLISIRLKSTMLNAVAIPSNYTIAPVAQSIFKYRVYKKAITTGGTWTSVGANSPVEYNLAPTAVTSGDIADEGFIISSNQSLASPSQQVFTFISQLEREPFTGVAYEYVLAAATTGTNQDVYSVLEWQEIT